MFEKSTSTSANRSLAYANSCKTSTLYLAVVLPSVALGGRRRVVDGGEFTTIASNSLIATAMEAAMRQ